MTLSHAYVFSLMLFSAMATDEDTLLQARLATAAQADQDTDNVDVSFLQVNQNSLLTTSPVEYFAEKLKLIQYFAQQPMNPTANLHPTNQTEHFHFISVNGAMCVEGPARTVAGGLALIKAGVHGMLWNNFLGGKPGTCASVFYTFSAGEHKQYPGLQTYSFNQTAVTAFGLLEDHAYLVYSQKYGLATDDAAIALHMCTSHPQSYNGLHYAPLMNCSAVSANQPGAWVHHDGDGIELMCDEGPFVDATFALAILKSTAQVRMHHYDQIAASTCAALGFPLLYPPIDHCFTGMHIWTRTWMHVDLGVQQSVAFENVLFNRTNTMNWYANMGLDAVMSSILFSEPGCHCAPHSEVRVDMVGCETYGPPIRDWWEVPSSV